MLDKISADDFGQCLNQKFRIRGDEQTIEAELVEVRGLESDTGHQGRSPFSVLFRGPLEAPLQQMTFRLENEKMGELDLFLVPIGPDTEEEGMLYEAVFT